MFSHVMLGSNDLERSQQFYDATLGALGTSRAGLTARSDWCYDREGALFMVASADRRPAVQPRQWLDDRLQRSTAPKQVDAWHAAGVEAGGTSIEDPPGIRDGGFGKLYLAYLRDPDGNKLCGFYRIPADSEPGDRQREQEPRRAAAGRVTPCVRGDRHRHDLLGLPAAAGRRAASSCRSLWYLSGLTCTHANVTEKGEYRAACAEHGLIFVAPDTSPRGEGVPDDPDGAWDFGLGAGFYVDATRGALGGAITACGPMSPRSLPALVAAEFPGRHGAAGHHRPFDGRAWRADRRAAPSRPLPQRLGLRADRRAEPGAVGREGARRLSRRRSRGVAQA